MLKREKTQEGYNLLIDEAGYAVAAERGGKILVRLYDTGYNFGVLVRIRRGDNDPNRFGILCAGKMIYVTVEEVDPLYEANGLMFEGFDDPFGPT